MPETYSKCPTTGKLIVTREAPSVDYTYEEIASNLTASQADTAKWQALLDAAIANGVEPQA